MGNLADQWRVSVSLLDSRVCICRQRAKVSLSWYFVFQCFNFILSCLGNAGKSVSMSIYDLVSNLNFKLVLILLIRITVCQNSAFFLLLPTEFQNGVEICVASSQHH